MKEKNKAMNIIPSILSDEREVVAKQLASILSSGEDYEIERVQMDIIDGEFADNITVTPLDLPDFEFGGLEVDLHLMTQEPLDFVYEAKETTHFVPIKRVIGQIEKMSNQEAFVEEVKKQHWLPGLCLDLYTPLSELSLDALEDVRVLQVMGIQAGFQGQQFNEHTYQVISELRELIERVNPKIELIVDGGVKPEHLGKLLELGVDSVVVGSVLWKAASIEEGLDSLYDELANSESEETF
ncbi:MAG: hypothetical protein CO156_05465 [Candidatus Pacebacteria bacterium CG_4_9_14_3_um_filter_40_12]|nr:MAG: hypothetical protein COU64_03480 [Candidatus Pacebacteria bacterium CG10_big_fil_rev_8_21_14_0_10_40_26]PIZ78733.1 MAG: hypothetical protein COY01_03850 [Candidatus Pacebacteria bacterium CG_4_10_14_0_2_um_filter_40_20]PJA68415.1 MAG: hypothetical protein CO156_05465 [Candidatus Pacebacteria bacterium CG_4_9_14_3_um_filter_40_12]PJC41277.1 MAG: hypothetical protein CO041_05535 [Candidatus Pacebacteria bacterium CG_4_9_14_0_2_um_filter_40_15]